MMCVVCKSGETSHGTQTITYERDGAVIVVQDVPAEVCSQCGAGYITGTTAVALDAQIDAAFRAGATLQIRHYAAA
jgi:YgiT-type zinc finger domain-containing protein